MSIEFRHVGKTFPDGTTAVEDFSLTIPSHETTVFVGSSGCGKTTLLRMINRMVDPSRGEILIDGRNIAGIPPVGLRRSIGYVMQNSGLLPHRTVADNVATVPLLTGVPKRKAREDALALLDRVGLDRSLADRYPAQLSGGQQQRVGVARGLAVDPNILLMDEPFGAVDPIVRDELQRELLRLQQELGKTVVFVTHDIDEAFLIGNQVVILQRGGRVAQVGTPREILRDPANEFVADFIGAKRGKRRLSAEAAGPGDDVLLVDSSGYAAGVIAAPGGRLDLAAAGAGPKSRSISNKTDQAGDA
ncbi:MAG: osmoprotectant transport system ATP-binding protein [Microbacteriaceae bacterium]|nr:osmoprotectant transport system ATP-binding protein [Microbacteriaceae bacterium]